MRCHHWMISVAITCVSAVMCWLGAEAALTLRAWRVLPEEALAEVEQARSDAMAEIVAARESLTMQIALARRDLRGEVHEAITRSDARLAEITGQTAALTQTAAQALTEAQTAVVELRGLVADTRRVQADYVRRIDYWTDCERNGYCWQGTLTDTMLSVRQAALEARKVAPQIAQSVESSARSIELTAQASSRTAEQIATITKPAPRWVRWLGVGLGVAAPAAQVAIAAGAVTKR